jgi:hypothetical protein
MTDIVMELTGCGPLEAARALAEHKEIWLAVDALLTKPTTSGDKYIPPPPKPQTFLDPEQEERCKKGRRLQDQINVVFSVAHSKTRTPQGLEAPGADPVETPACPPSSPDLKTEQPQGAVSKTTPQVQQSAQLR